MPHTKRVLFNCRIIYTSLGITCGHPMDILAYSKAEAITQARAAHTDKNILSVSCFDSRDK